MDSIKNILNSKGKLINQIEVQIKGGDSFTRGGFTQIPNSLLQDKGLSSWSRLVYALLLSFAWNQKDTCFPGQQTLADKLGISLKTIERSIKELKNKNYLEIKIRGLHKTGLYLLKIKSFKKI